MRMWSNNTRLLSGLLPQARRDVSGFCGSSGSNNFTADVFLRHPPFVFSHSNRRSSFHGHTFSEVARFIDVAAELDCEMPPEKVITIPSGSTRPTLAFVSPSLIILKSSARPVGREKDDQDENLRNHGRLLSG